MLLRPRIIHFPVALVSFSTSLLWLPLHSTASLNSTARTPFAAQLLCSAALVPFTPLLCSSARVSSTSPLLFVTALTAPVAPVTYSQSTTAVAVHD